jgi:hypothetical protein
MNFLLEGLRLPFQSALRDSGLSMESLRMKQSEEPLQDLRIAMRKVVT